MDNNFSKNLKKIRKEHNLSQEQLAEELGVSRQAISKWESATAYPEMDKIIALCTKFKLNIDDLLHKNIKEVKEEEESKKKLNKSIEDFLNFITDTINLFSNMNFKSKIKCLLEETIITGILLIISIIIISIGNSIFTNILGILPYKINYFIHNILNSIIILFCIVTSIIILIHTFKTRYLNYYSNLKKEINNLPDDKIKNDMDNINNEDITIDDKNKILLQKNENKIIIRDPKHSEYRFINGLFKFIIGIVKSFVLCFSIFICFILICLFSLFIISFLIYKTGIFFIGIIGAILSSSLTAIIILLITLNFVFNRKNDKKKIIWGFIFSLITLGISCGLIFVGTLNFEVILNDETMLEIRQIEYEMNDNIFFNTYQNDIKYIESNTNNIKLEYKVNKYCELETYSEDNHGIHIYASCPNPIKLVNEFIKNINNKKIISINNEIHDIAIYASKENIEKIKTNQINYYKKQKEHNETINSYENVINQLEDKLEKYEDKINEYENKIYNLEEQIKYYRNNSNE